MNPTPTVTWVLDPVLPGFVDYFFHAHVAEFLNARSWDVYALDLRRSGRWTSMWARSNVARCHF